MAVSKAAAVAAASIPAMPPPGLSSSVLESVAKGMLDLQGRLDAVQREADAQRKAEQIKSMGPAAEKAVMNKAEPLPGVKELCDRFKIEGEIVKRFENELRRRPLTYLHDLQVVAKALELAPTPAGLMLQIKGMQQGSFISDFPIAGVQEFRKRYPSITDEVIQALEYQLRRRPTSFEGDLETVEEALRDPRREKAPITVLIAKIKEMQNGTFTGVPANHKLLQEMATKFEIDAKALNVLTEHLGKIGKEKAKTAIAHLITHLERSNKPSAMVMVQLKKLRAGEEIGESNQKASQGSKLWEQQKAEKEKEDLEKEREREADRQQKRSRSRGREAYGSRHGRDRDTRDDSRSRDREHERGRNTANRHRDQHRDSGREPEHDRDRGRNDRDLEREQIGRAHV